MAFEVLTDKHQGRGQEGREGGRMEEPKEGGGGGALVVLHSLWVKFSGNTWGMDTLFSTQRTGTGPRVWCV